MNRIICLSEGKIQKAYDGQCKEADQTSIIPEGRNQNLYTLYKAITRLYVSLF